jgi:hypothetical protein
MDVRAEWTLNSLFSVRSAKRCDDVPMQREIVRQVNHPRRKLMKIIRVLVSALLACLLAPAVLFAQQDDPPKTTSAQADAKAAFAKLKTLTGSWQGTVMNLPITFTIRAASSGTVLLHEGHTSAAGPPKNEITMFYLNGDRLLATHYCDAGNRTNLEGKLSGDENALVEFSFLEVVGSTRGGYLKDMAITMVDADHHVVTLTFIMPDGKPIPLRGEFQRTK